MLELKVPHSPELSAVADLLPVFGCYVLSFVHVGIYWNNHHLLHAARRVSGGVLWANLHLLFWLSLVPFVTGWMGENHFAAIPTAAYGAVMLMAGVAYLGLQLAIIAADHDSPLRAALGRDVKGKLSAVLYVVAIVAAHYEPLISGLLYVGVALMWLVPDRRIERALEKDGAHHG